MRKGGSGLFDRRIYLSFQNLEKRVCRQGYGPLENVAEGRRERGLGEYLNSQAKALPSRILAISFKSLVIFPSIGFIGTPTLIVHSVANFSIPNFSSAGTRSSYEGCRAKACLTTSSARLKTAVLASFVIVGIELSTVHSAPGGDVRLNALDRQINIVVFTAPIRNCNQHLPETRYMKDRGGNSHVELMSFRCSVLPRLWH